MATVKITVFTAVVAIYDVMFYFNLQNGFECGCVGIYVYPNVLRVVVQ